MELKLFIEQLLDVVLAFLNTSSEQANYCVEISVIAEDHLDFALHENLLPQIP